jgi:hypothetical protein
MDIELVATPPSRKNYEELFGLPSKKPIRQQSVILSPCRRKLFPADVPSELNQNKFKPIRNLRF